MSASENRVSFQETSQFYSLSFHGVLTKSSFFHVHLSSAGASPGLWNTSHRRVQVCPEACGWVPCSTTSACAHSHRLCAQEPLRPQELASCKGPSIHLMEDETSESVSTPKTLWTPWSNCLLHGLPKRPIPEQRVWRRQSWLPTRGPGNGLRLCVQWAGASECSNGHGPVWRAMHRLPSSNELGGTAKELTSLLCFSWDWEENKVLERSHVCQRRAYPTILPVIAVFDITRKIDRLWGTKFSSHFETGRKCPGKFG